MCLPFVGESGVDDSSRAWLYASRVLDRGPGQQRLLIQPFIQVLIRPAPLEGRREVYSSSCTGSLGMDRRYW